MARRYLHVLGPTTPDAFARWAGVGKRQARTTFEELADSLTAVHTPIGEAWILSDDIADLRATPGPDAPVRLLPSGDAYWLLHDDQRELLVDDPDDRDR